MSCKEQIEQMCRNITTLSGVACAMTDEQNQLLFHSTDDSASVCIEGSRRIGRHLYQCETGELFFLFQQQAEETYQLVVGPFVLEDETEQAACPVLHREQMQALHDIAQAVCGYLSERKLMTAQESRFQHEMLQNMVHSMDNVYNLNYPLEQERNLQQMIRSGDKKEARQLLNELLVELYAAVGTDLTMLKLRIRELITLMSRAATDSGANVNAVFALCDNSVMELERLQDFEQLDTWLAGLLHQFFDQVFEFNDTKHQAVLCQVFAYIQGHLSEKLTLDQIARQVYLSKSYLCRILREELDTTFTEYTNRLRIERSKLYLQRSSMSLTEIACAVGFEDQSYFTRIFKRQVGVPPGKYRANNMSA